MCGIAGLLSDRPVEDRVLLAMGAWLKINELEAIDKNQYTKAVRKLQS